MSAPFERALGKTLGIEGGFSDDPVDRGGPTNHGITEKLARSYGWAGPMNELPMTLIRHIYRKEFWDRMRLDEVSALAPDLADELFDTSVLSGWPVVARWLQRSLNVFNRLGKDYADIAVDGQIGPQTLRALTALLAFRGRAGETVLLGALTVLHGVQLMTFAERVPDQERFVFGWFLKRIEP